MFVYIFTVALVLPLSRGLTEYESARSFNRQSEKIATNVQNAEDLETLLRNVSTIYISGSPGFISVYGPEAFPVLAGQKGSSTGIYHPIAAAGRLGKGKLLGMTHDAILNPETNPVLSDTNEFILNCVSWTSQAPNPNVALIRNEEDPLVEFLGNSSIPTVRISTLELANADQLKNFSVVLVKQFFNATLVPILTEYAENGDGLIISLTSWAYYYYMDVPGHFGSNWPANMISTKVGFAWHDSAIGDPTTSNGSYNASTALLEDIEVLEAWEEIKEVLNTGYPEDSDIRLQQYSSILEYGFELIPPFDPFWTGNYYAEAQNYTQVGGQPIPSKEDPVTDDLDKFELQVFHALSTSVLKPEDTPAHPASSIFPGDIATNSPEHASSEEITVVLKRPSWFDDLARSSKDPWSYVPNSINICHEGEKGGSSANHNAATATDEDIEVSNELPLWFSTGLYARPGQVITVTLQSEDILDSYGVQIGSHSDDISHLDEWFRSPRIAVKSNFENNTATIASPYGGLIYILVPEKEISEQERTIKALVIGSTRAPYFRLGVTQKREWMNRIRYEPGPWTEFVTDNIVLTVPSSSIRELDDPEDLLLFWDRAMDAIADLVAIPRERYRLERMVPDVQISAGFMHSGYPIMTFLNEGNMAVNVTLLRTEGSWGHFHELGHNHQSSDWTFEGTGEVTCNLFPLYIMNTVCGIPIERCQEHMTPEFYKTDVSAYIMSGLDFSEWKSNPWLALMTYVQLQRTYGWTAFKQVFAKYRDLPDGERPSTNQEKIDMWMVMFSHTVEEDLFSFFQSWGFPISDEARNSVSVYPEAGISIFDLLND